VFSRKGGGRRGRSAPADVLGKEAEDADYERKIPSSGPNETGRGAKKGERAVKRGDGKRKRKDEPW